MRRVAYSERGCGSLPHAGPDGGVENPGRWVNWGYWNGQIRAVVRFIDGRGVAPDVFETKF